MRDAHSRTSVRAALSGAIALALVTGSVLIASDAAFAAGSVSIDASAATAPSNQTTTYTLNVTCSTTGGCTGASVTFPVTTLAGDGTTTDFGSWVAKGTCPTFSVASGTLTFPFGDIPTGTQQCKFTMRAPEYTTWNGAQATVTPTFNATNSASTKGSSVVLTVTAGHNDSVSASAPAKAPVGVPLTLSLGFTCGLNGGYVGDIGLSHLHMEAVLPSNFVYQGYGKSASGLGGTITPPAAGSTGGTLVYDGDGSDCADPPLIASNRFTISIAGYPADASGVDDPVGQNVCVSATAAFTYIDGTTDSQAKGPACAVLINLATTSDKTVSTYNINSSYTFPGDGNSYPYTFPGDWNSTGGKSTHFTLSASTNPQSTNSGVSYQISDPLPCLDDAVAHKATSNDPGEVCAHPAYLPNQLSLTSGFSATASDTITLVYVDGTTGTVAPSANVWKIPSSPVVSEIDIPAFPEEGANTKGSISFDLQGIADPQIDVNTLLENVSTTQAYLAGSSDTLGDPQVHMAHLLVADPAEDKSVTLYPGLTVAANTAACTETIRLNSTTNSVLTNKIEIGTAPSRAIYVDYLAPSNSQGATSTATTFSLKGGNGEKTYTSASISPVVTKDYNGTGRDLYEWTIPAGLATVPGVYEVRQTTPMYVVLEPGCAGLYQNDMTLGYGTKVTTCIFDDYHTLARQVPPMAPRSNDDLDTNASPIAGNYCGFSAPLRITPINPGFSVDKTVQGNLDSTPVNSGGVGKVSPTGGAATYAVTFTNSGLSNLHDPVMYDLLPRQNDTEATTTTPRGSAFGVQLSSVRSPLPPNVTLSYSTAANPCRPEVLPNASNPGCVDQWSATPPSPLSNTTALRIEYHGTVGVSGSTFPHSFSVSYDVTTPATAAGNVAWNTVGTNTRVGETGDDTDSGDPFLGAAESSRTGLTASTSNPQIVKAAGRSTYSNVGDTLDFTFDVTNVADVPLSGVTLTDAFTDAPSGATPPTVRCETLSSPAGSCTSATSTTLGAHQTARFTATYTVTQADLDHGLLTDIATATGQPATGDPITNTSNTVTVDAVADPDLVLSKTATPTVVTKAGQTVTYGFDVTNNGNQTVKSIVVQDSDFSGSDPLDGITCADTTLAPRASTHCEVVYTVTQDDIDSTAKKITNTATVAAATATGAAVESDPDEATVTVTQSPGITLEKTASVTQVEHVGDPIRFDLLVTNSGNVTLTGLEVDETGFAGVGRLGDVDCPDTTLAPEQSTTCTAEYTVEQGDLDAGAVTNTASASANDPAGAPVGTGDKSAVVTATRTATLSLTKTADPATISAAGTAISYDFVVTNTGNVTVHGIGIDDPMLTADCPIADLGPGEHETCTGSYTATQSDIDHGSIDNVATATGEQGAVTSAEATATVAVTQNPLLTITKTASPTSAGRAGDTVHFEFSVHNGGNVTMTGAAINDSMFDPSEITCEPGAASMAPDDDATCSADYTVTQADVDAGGITNTATATGAAPGAAPASFISDPSTAAVTIAQDAELQLTKTADVMKVTADGQEIGYTFHIVNSGNVTVNGVAVEEQTFTGSDSAPTIDCPAGATSLAPGDDIDCTATYTIAASDQRLTAIDNTAVATGVASTGSVISDPSSAHVDVDIPAPGGLAETGLAGVGTGIAAGAGLLGLGAVLFLIRRRRNA